MYKALYRQYRPTTFDQIVGQQHIVRTLSNAILQHKLGHAYLFHGPRGTGKTSIAKIFAQALNCEGTMEQSIPCHACESCKAIDEQVVTDIIEMDAASNNGVDEIRTIREFARYAPTSLRYKVYIIDEVHMLSTAAFNALLKTLEEPPKHVIFILATTEIHKIPATIISRCQRFDFQQITPVEMKECVHRILQQENLVIEEPALDVLVTYADGGMRDALSVLDQAIAYGDSSCITVEHVTDVVGIVSDDVYVQLLNCVLKSDTQTSLQLLDMIIQKGKNVQLFVEGFLRFLLQEIEKQLANQSLFEKRILFFMLENMNRLAYEMKRALLPQIALQALFIELTYETTQAYQGQLVGNAALLVKEDPDVGASAEVGAAHKIVAHTETKSELYTEEMPTVKTAVPALQEALEPKIAIESDTDLVQKDTSKQEQPTEDILTLFDEDSFTLYADTLQAESEPTPAAHMTVDEAVQEEIDVVFDFSKTASNVDVDNPKTTLPKPETIDPLDQDPAITDTPEHQVASDLSLAASVQEPSTPAQSTELDVIPTYQTTAVEAVKTKPKPVEPKSDQQTLIGEQHKLFLQRIMAEVMIYPEYNNLEKIKRKWQLIKFDPSNPIAGMLLDVEPKIATKVEIVLACFHKSLAQQFQLLEQKERAEQFLHQLIGQKYTIIVVDEAFWLKQRELFSQKWKAKEINEATITELAHGYESLEEEAKRQGYEYVTLEFGEAVADEPKVIQEAKELFGDLVEVE